jgi:ABC-type transport system involved in multi-copper enzyme maturation permease subunit
MTVLPIVARELKVRATHRGFHWVRPGLAAFAVLFCLQRFNFSATGLNSAEAGLVSFTMLAQLALVVALGASILSADCVSSERREGTLGLLFLTTLKSRDVTLGKFVATGLTALYVLAGFLPVLMVPLLLGGVTGGEVVRTAVSSINVMFVSLAAGLFVSVFARTQFGSILLTFVLLAFLIVVPLIVQLMLPTPIPLAAVFSPTFAYFASGQGVAAPEARSFWWALGIEHLLGWLLVGAAVLSLGWNWREVFQPRSARIPPPQVRGLIGAPRVLLSGPETKKRAFAPVARAVLRMPGQQGLAWLGACLSLFGSLSAAFAVRAMGSIWAATSVTVIFGFACSALFAFVAGRFFFEARRSGELELLLVTPTGAKGILREQRFALVRMLRGPFYLAVVGTIPVAASGVTLFEGKELLGLGLALCHVAEVASGIVAICWVAMWFGSRVHHSLAIIGWSVGLVELLPTALAYLLPAVLLGWPQSILELWLIIVPPLLLLKNFIFIAFARDRLRKEFRADDGVRFTRFFRSAPLPEEAVPVEQPQTP